MQVSGPVKPRTAKQSAGSFIVFKNSAPAAGREHGCGLLQDLPLMAALHTVASDVRRPDSDNYSDIGHGMRQQL